MLARWVKSAAKRNIFRARADDIDAAWLATMEARIFWALWTSTDIFTRLRSSPLSGSAKEVWLGGELVNGKGGI